MRQQYVDRLLAFKSNETLRELLSELVLDIRLANEEFYLKNGRYPEQRDPVGKLLIDLETVKSITNKEEK